MTELEPIIRQLIPDWHDMPVYPVLQSEGIPPAFVRSQVGGYYSAILCRALGPWLKREGRWRGPGVCFVIQDDFIRQLIADMAPDDTTLARKLSSHWIIGSALHEAAHALDRPPVEDAESEEFECLALASVVGANRQHAMQTPEPDDIPPVPGWYQHGSAFIRCCLHLHARYIRHFGPIHSSTSSRLTSTGYRIRAAIAMPSATRFKPCQTCRSVTSYRHPCHPRSISYSSPT
jgi:hypothetical protein